MADNEDNPVPDEDEEQDKKNPASGVGNTGDLENDEGEQE